MTRKKGQLRAATRYRAPRLRPSEQSVQALAFLGYNSQGESSLGPQTARLPACYQPCCFGIALRPLFSTPTPSASLLNRRWLVSRSFQSPKDHGHTCSWRLTAQSPCAPIAKQTGPTRPPSCCFRLCEQPRGGSSSPASDAPTRPLAASDSHTLQVQGTRRGSVHPCLCCELVLRRSLRVAHPYMTLGLLPPFRQYVCFLFLFQLCSNVCPRLNNFASRLLAIRWSNHPFQYSYRVYPLPFLSIHTRKRSILRGSPRRSDNSVKMVAYRMVLLAGAAAALPLNINLGAYSPALVVGKRIVVGHLRFFEPDWLMMIYTNR